MSHAAMQGKHKGKRYEKFELAKVLVNGLPVCLRISSNNQKASTR